MAIGEAVEQGISFCAAACLDGGLRAEIVGVVVESIAGTLGEGEVGERLGIAMVERVAVREGKVCGGGRLAGMRLRIGQHAGVGRSGACGGELLGHWPELLRGVERADQLNAARAGRGAMQRMRETRGT